MKKKLLFLMVLCTLISKVNSQQIWQKNKKSFYKRIEQNHNNLTLNKNLFLGIVKDIPKRNDLKTSSHKITLPIDENKFEVFEVFEASNFNSELSKKFPSIKSYIAKSNNSSKTARISYDKYTGFHASIFTDNGTIIINPSNKEKNEYLFYNKKDNTKNSEFECTTIEQIKKVFQSKSRQLNAVNDGYLRKYRVAIAATGEYSSFFLTGSEVNDEEKKATILAAINNSLTRINGIFERDFGITMELIASNDQLIFLDSATDPFNAGNYNQELQTTLDSTIGTENYDVGHVFIHSSRIYGNAGCIACVCTEGEKGSAFTAHTDPSSDHFNMIASHEFGHQFGGYHVQSSPNCRSGNNSEVEPGSGSSIMGYAGICPPNVQEHPDDYFNYVDIRDIIEWTRNESSCAELITTGNNDPTVDAGQDYTIPINTAFILTGSADDEDNNTLLTYCWEQNDPEGIPSASTPQSNWSQGPLFRSKLPVSYSTRHFPQLEDVINGNLTPTWEVLPSVARTMDFALTVRDNAPIGPKTASDLMTVTVIDNGGAFTVSSQNSTENWNVGDSKLVTWEVANTNTPPINATNVEILLSIDGGYTYPYTISSSTPNTGSANIIIPEIPESTSRGRIMIKPTTNIFYAINSADISIQTSEFVMSFSNKDKNVCKPNTIEYNFIYKTYLGFNESTDFSTENLSDNFSTLFEPNNVTDNNTPVKLTITTIDNTPIGQVNFNVVGTSNTTIKKSSLLLNVYDSNISSPTLSSPNNNSSGINSINTILEWNKDDNIDNYIVEITPDSSFENNIQSTTVNTNSYTINTELNYNTTYYWRVKGENSCGKSEYSNTFSFTTKCFTPTGIKTSNITTNATDISWVDPSNSNKWEIEIITSGTTPIGVGNLTTNKPYMVTNLDSGTTYDIYVRSICSETNYSDWSGPYKFETLADFCNGDKFYDTGGENGVYSDNENTQTLIFPINADIVEINFEAFQLENNYDYLTIYDGNDINAPLIGRYTGTSSPGNIRSKQGQGITFVFTSDGSVIGAGWAASVNCITITCPAPTDFTYNNLLGDAIDLSWTSNGTESQWEIEYGVKGFVKNTGNKILTSSNPATINSLTPETEYDFYITAICGDTPTDDDSFSVGPLTIKTPCNTFNAPYNFNVESQNTNSTIENCWSGDPEIYNGDYYWTAQYSRFDNSNTTGPLKAHEGRHYFSTKYNRNQINDEAKLLSPIIDISTLTSPTLNFHTFMFGENIGSLHIDIFNNGTWNEDVFILNGQQQESINEFWEEHFIDLSAYTNQIQIRFKAISNNGSNNEIAIDDINIYNLPNCIKPSNLEYSNTTATTVDLSWTANGNGTSWVVEHGTSGFTPGTGTSIIANSNNYTLESLPSNSEVEIYIKTTCGSNPGEDDSDIIGPLKIKTPCNTFNAPYNFDVENQNTNSTIENCWNGEPEVYNGSYYWKAQYSRFNNNNTTGPLKANKGSLYFSTRDNGSIVNEEAILLSPIIDISTLTTPTLNFHTFMFGENIGNLHIDIFNNGTWHENVFVLNGQQQQSINDFWEEHFIDLSTYTNQIQVRFKAISNGGYNSEVAIDDINIYNLPNCIKPSNLEYNNVTATTVDLSWTANGNGTSWIVEYGTPNFTLGTGTTVITNSDNYTLENLPSNSEIEIYVRSTCGSNPGESDSDAIGPLKIKTPCDIFNAPYNFNVENQNTNSIIENCWSGDPEIYDGSYYWTAQYSRYRENNTTGPFKANKGNHYFSTRDDGSTANQEAILLSPIVDISSLVTPTLNFHTFMFGENIGSLHIDIFNNDTWNEDVFILSGQQQESINSFWEEHFIDLSTYTNQIQIRFRTISNGLYNNEIAIDDINIFNLPNCIKPSNLEYSNLTATTADLSWNANGNGTSWIIEYGTPNFTPGTGTSVTVNSNNYTLENLPSNSEIEIYIKSTCGNNPREDDSDAIGPLKIKTPCNTFNAPWFYDTENQNTNTIIEDCWSNNPDRTESQYFWEAQRSNFYDSRTTGPYQAYSGSKYFRTVLYGGAAGDETNLVSPSINVDNLTTPTLNFFAFMYGNNIGSLHIDVYNNGIWTNDIKVITGEQQTSSRDLWNEYYIDLSNFSNDLKVRFRAVSTGPNTHEIDIDDISIIEKPNCIIPTEITFDTVTSNSIDLSWTSNNDTSTQYVIEYGTEGFSQGSGITTIINNSNLSATNLDSNTAYDFYIKSECTSNNSSNWAGPFTKKTIPNYCNGDHFYDTGGLNNTYSDNENYTTTIYPKEAGNFVTVYFNSFQLESCCDFLYIYDGEDTDATLIGSYNGNNNPGIITSTHDTGALTFKFTSDGSATYSGWDATIICNNNICIAPSNIEVLNTYRTAVQLNWTSLGTETNWIVEYGETGFTPGTGTEIEATSLPFILTGLNSLTTYDTYIKAKCDTETSTYSSPVTFTTKPDYCKGDRFYDPGGADNNYENNESYSETIFPTRGSDRVIVNFDSFELESCCDYLYIYDGIDSNARLIGRYKGNNNPGLIIPTNESGALTFVFSSDGSGTYPGWEATVTCQRDCLSPYNPLITDITSNSANLTWEPGGNEKSWRLFYGDTAVIGEFDLDSNNYAFTNLAPSTTYTYYIKSHCGEYNGDSDSEWIGPFYFTTGCDNTINAPYHEDFSLSSAPNCWTEGGFKAWNFNTEAIYDGTSIEDHTEKSTSNYAWINSGDNKNSEIPNFLKTGFINIENLNSPSLQFSAFNKNSIDNQYNTLTVKLHTQSNDSHSILILDRETQEGWETFTVNLGDYITNTDIIQIEFIINENISSNSTDNNILIDDVIIDNYNTLSTESVQLEVGDLKYFPNPVTNILTVENSIELTKIEVFNLIGQKLILEKMNDFKTNIDFSMLESGTYLVKVYSNTKNGVFKIVKNK